ncbi:MAG: YceI family protein [Candidatus Krumholzibacteriia bacterium]
MKNLPVIIGVTLCLGVFVLPLASAGGDERSADRLVVFTQPESAIGRVFARHTLARIESLAAALGTGTTVLDASAGAPADVAITPLLVFQNHLGRSIYQGRYTDLGKIAHFIRTSRAVPQRHAMNPVSDAAVWRVGRAVIAAHVKVTPLTGVVPGGFDQAAFVKRARAGVFAGLTRHHQEARTELRRSDRSFYMDFYPYLTGDGRLMVSLSLFSQFNCIEPVYTSRQTPVQGEWTSLAEVFSRAAAIMESEIADQVETSPLGDGFDPLPGSARVAAWIELGLALPEAPAGVAHRPAQDVAMPRDWVIESAGDGPGLQFRFLPPLDSYSGEVTGLEAALTLGERDGGATLERASGWFEIATHSITMADTSLDDDIHNQIIHVPRYPTSRFTLREFTDASRELTFGETSRVVARGTFELKGKSIPLTAQAQIEPIIDGHGRPKLHVSATTRINLKEDFELEGPLGPAPASDIIEIYIDIIMKQTTPAGQYAVPATGG